MKKLFYVLLILILAGCARVQKQTVDLFELYETDLEAYKALYEENKGVFFNNWVIGDIHVRWECLRFMQSVIVRDVQEDALGCYQVTSEDDKTFIVAIKSKDRIIVDFTVREEK